MYSHRIYFTVGAVFLLLGFVVFREGDKWQRDVGIEFVTLPRNKDRCDHPPLYPIEVLKMFILPIFHRLDCLSILAA